MKQQVVGAKCLVDSCERAEPKMHLGYCNAHYLRLNKHGDVQAHKPVLIRRCGTSSDRFWSRVDMSDPDGCWLWTGPVQQRGYGAFHPTRDRTLPAHVFAWEEANDPALRVAGMDVDHLCCVRLCVRPSHLELVTHAENVRRAKERANQG